MGEVVGGVFEPFLLIGFILFFGFLAGKIAQRRKISEVLPLVILGILIGPVLGIVDVSPGSDIREASQFIGALALIILLFDGGIKLDVFKLVGALPKSTLFTISAFIISIFSVGALTHILLGWSQLESLLLGAAVGGTSSAIVLAMIEKSRTTDDSRSLLTVESTITDVLCILTAFIVLRAMQSSEEIGIAFVLNLFASAFSVAILLGALSAVLWIFLLKKIIGNSEPDYILTLAMLSLLYGFTEVSGGNGAIAVFTFGLVLGNAATVARKIGYSLGIYKVVNIRIIQSEVTFFVRTFFFVYIGLLVTSAIFEVQTLAMIFVLFAAILVGRYLAGKAILGKTFDLPLIVMTGPRGLAAAVLATLPAQPQFGLSLPLFYPVTFGIILLSNIAATGGLFLIERGHENVDEEEEGRKKWKKVRKLKVKKIEE